MIESDQNKVNKLIYEILEDIIQQRFCRDKLDELGRLVEEESEE